MSIGPFRSRSLSVNIFRAVVYASCISLSASGLLACAGVTRAGLLEGPVLSPFAGSTDPVLPVTTGGLPGPATEESGKGSQAAVGVEAEGEGVRDKLRPQALSATVPSMVPARGDARAQAVASAVRLLGISGSFDDRSFLGHVLRINDILPQGASATSYPASEYLRMAKAAGGFRAAESARPGDLMFFECRKGCGASASDGISAGVVESTDGGNTMIVAYIGGAVQRCATGKVAADRHIAALDAALGVVDPWAIASGGNASR